MKRKFQIGMFLMILMVVSGCSYYSSTPATKDEMIGTYKLTKYSKKDDEGNIYDYQKEIGAEAYFVLQEEGYGYYAYRDDNTSVFCKQTMFKYVDSSEEEGKYEAIEMNDGKTSMYTWNKYVGCMDEPTMGFNDKLLTKTFSYTIPGYTYTLHNPPTVQKYQYVCYTKVNDDTTLKTLNKKMGTSFEFNKPFELYGCEGYYAYTRQVIEESEFITTYSNDSYDYMILDMDDFNQDGVLLYYSPINSNIKMTARIPVDLVNDGQLFKEARLNIFSNTYCCTNNYNTLGTVLFRNYNNDPEEYGSLEKFSKYYGVGNNIDEIIANLGR